MPGGSGLELIERMKGRCGCEFIILSGYDQFEYAKKAVFLGVKGYILKPLDEEELRTVLESAIRSLEQKRAGAQPALVYNEGNTTAERYLQRACAWMEEHCDEQITLRHVASELKISDSYLGKLFKSSGGPMFQEYMRLPQGAAIRTQNISAPCSAGSLASTRRTSRAGTASRRDTFSTPYESRERHDRTGKADRA